jgi:hypothetical protein
MVHIGEKRTDGVMFNRKIVNHRGTLLPLLPCCGGCAAKTGVTSTKENWGQSTLLEKTGARGRKKGSEVINPS